MSVTLFIIALTGIISYLAFQNNATFDKLCNYPVDVWEHNDWSRLLSSGFIHANYSHIIFNMLSLWMFGATAEAYFGLYLGSFGPAAFIAFYVGAIIFANIPDLFLHKHDYYYRAVGASGGVSAVIYACILFCPIELKIWGLPAFVFGFGYLAYEFYMAKQQSDNVGHTAHFAGALYGLTVPILFNHQVLPNFFAQILGR